MVIVNFKELLINARKDKRAIGSFNVYNYETIKGVIEAGRELKHPVIISFGEVYLKNMDLDIVFEIVNSLTKQSNYPVVLHMDHAKSIENIRLALDRGFTSVMFDGSSLPFEENVKLTKEVVKLASSYNASVEAELGAIGEGIYSNEGGADVATYTDPFEAKEFIEKTGVHALAVSIGTVHGMYKGDPNIRLDLLREISKVVKIPLVLHGGSGTPENIIKECIISGISKINVNTEISTFVIEQLTNYLNENSKEHLSHVSLKEIEWVKQVCKKYINLFNNN